MVNDIKIILVLIYILGFVITYTYLKYLRNKKDMNNWDDVLMTMLMSLFSFVGLLVVLSHAVRGYFKNSKPPKFL